MPQWIDFKELRSRIKIEDVLRSYNVELKIKGDRAKAVCPLPCHQHKEEGRRRALSFSASLSRHLFQCFGCRASGNVLDLAAYLEGLDPKDPQQLRQAAIKLQERLKLTGSERRSTTRPAVPVQTKPAVATPSTATPVVNAPLDFTLKKLDPDHVYLRKRDFDPQTIRYFGLGYCSKGLFAGRIAIPLHSMTGELVGYAGRLTDEFDVSPESPAYLWPGDRERQGVKHVFDRNRIVYHGYRFKAPVADLVVVQDFPSVWRIVQAGISNVVGITDETPSAEQTATIRKLTKPAGRMWIVTSNTRSTECWAQQLFFDLGSHSFCRWIRLTDRIPADLKSTEIRKLLEVK